MTHVPLISIYIFSRYVFWASHFNLALPPPYFFASSSHLPKFFCLSSHLPLLCHPHPLIEYPACVVSAWKKHCHCILQMLVEPIQKADLHKYLRVNGDLSAFLLGLTWMLSSSDVVTVSYAATCPRWVTMRTSQIFFFGLSDDLPDWEPGVWDCSCICRFPSTLSRTLRGFFQLLWGNNSPTNITRKDHKPKVGQTQGFSWSTN